MKVKDIDTVKTAPPKGVPLVAPQHTNATVAKQLRLSDDQDNIKNNWNDIEFVKNYHKQYYNNQKIQNKYTDCECGKKYLNICKKSHLNSKRHQLFNELLTKITKNN